MISRRSFTWGTGAVALSAALNGLSVFPARAQSELTVPPTLGEMALGNANAAVTVIEYASLWCSHCGHFYRTIYPEFRKRYIDTGKVHFLFREFPLNERGALGSMLARCAARDGGKDKFFAVVDMLFEKQDAWAYVKDPAPPLLALAKQAGFTEQSFKACLADQKLLDALEADQNRAEAKLGVDSTPTFFVNGKKVEDVGSIGDLAKVIDPLLKQ
jgi:protein-disulfide isomerase